MATPQPGLRPGSGNMLDPSNMNTLQKAFNNKNSIFGDDAYEFGGNQITEEQVVRGIIGSTAKQLTTYASGNRTLELPGLNRNLKMVVAAVAHFKNNNYDGTVRRPEDVGFDNVTIQFATPDVYSAHNQQGNHDNFEQTGLTAGNVQQIAPNANAGSANGDTAQLRDEEYMVFTGDFIDLNSDGIVTKVQYSDIDGDDWEESSHWLSEQNTDNQVNTVPGAWVKSTYDIDALVAYGGDINYFPVAFQIAKGEHVPDSV